jgi:hypothetical protein
MLKYRLFNTKQIGTKNVRRPKLRWEDDVGVKNWRNLAMEKKIWQKLLRPGPT